MVENREKTDGGSIEKGAYRILFLNTLAFTVCFAAWMLNGVLITFLTSNQLYNWSASEGGWLMGIPVLTGSLFRLPAGLLTDKYGGRPVMTALLVICAVPMFFLSFANSFTEFALASFAFGLAGVSFSIGIAYTSVWFPKNKQGSALGVFGAGTAGAALTTLFGPSILNLLTNNGENLENWRRLPIMFGIMLIVTSIIFFAFSTNRKPKSSNKTLKGLLEPLKRIRVWRFGLYYFLVFGCFVAFSQWLVPYFVNVYYLPLVTAGFLAACFSLPSGVTRAIGGFISDRFGGRKVMYWVLGLTIFISFLLIIPRMEITSPGKGVVATRDGVVTSISKTQIAVNDTEYTLEAKTENLRDYDGETMVFPVKEAWQEPVVEVGQTVQKKELLAKGVTKIFFQANVWVFSVLVIFLGIVWGAGMAAVFKHIPEYFPDEVGVVGGMVGVLGGLGGFVSPIIFGYLLDYTGLWTSSWMFVFVIATICIIWMHFVIQKMMTEAHPNLMKKIERD